MKMKIAAAAFCLLTTVSSAGPDVLTKAVDLTTQQDLKQLIDPVTELAASVSSKTATSGAGGWSALGAGFCEVAGGSCAGNSCGSVLPESYWDSPDEPKYTPCNPSSYMLVMESNEACAARAD